LHPPSCQNCDQIRDPPSSPQRCSPDPSSGEDQPLTTFSLPPLFSRCQVLRLGDGPHSLLEDRSHGAFFFKKEQLPSRLTHLSSFSSPSVRPGRDCVCWCRLLQYPLLPRILKGTRVCLKKIGGRELFIHFCPRSCADLSSSTVCADDKVPLTGIPGSRFERTFIAIKPDGVQRGIVGEIIQRFEKKGYKLVGIKVIPSFLSPPLLLPCGW